MLWDEIEWIETVEAGWNVLAGVDTERIAAAAKESSAVLGRPHPVLYGDGHAAERIAAVLTTPQADC